MFGNESAKATASVLLDMSPAPPTAMIFSTPASRARAITSAASPAYSLLWICAWLSINIACGIELFFRIGFDAREQNFGRIDLVTGNESLTPRRV